MRRAVARHGLVSAVSLFVFGTALVLTTQHGPRVPLSPAAVWGFYRLGRIAVMSIAFGLMMAFQKWAFDTRAGRFVWLWPLVLAGGALGIILVSPDYADRRDYGFIGAMIYWGILAVFSVGATIVNRVLYARHRRSADSSPTRGLP